MNRFANLVALLLLLVAAAPVLACVTGSPMSQAENACCRVMRGQCGAMAGDAKMGCCRTEAQTETAPQLATALPVTDIHWVAVASTVDTLLPFRTPLLDKLPMPENYLPPGIATAKTSVLRI